MTTSLQKVDIIICARDAPDYLKACYSSLMESDAAGCAITIVDDGSDEPARTLIGSLARECHVIVNERNLGYTRSINKALKSVNKDYALLLNSDTLVPATWLGRLLACLLSHPDNGIVGPLSNAASYQSVPFVWDARGQFHVNALPLGMDVDTFNEFISSRSTCAYPEIPIANGFCMLFRRELLDVIGFFDEENFPEGYGEENDFCYRAYLAGYKIRCADNVYVYHAKSKSFGERKRSELVQKSGAKLRAKYHGGDIAGYTEAGKSALDEIRESLNRNLVEEYIKISKGVIP